MKDIEIKHNAPTNWLLSRGPTGDMETSGIRLMPFGDEGIDSVDIHPVGKNGQVGKGCVALAPDPEYIRKVAAALAAMAELLENQPQYRPKPGNW